MGNGRHNDAVGLVIATEALVPNSYFCAPCGHAVAVGFLQE